MTNLYNIKSLFRDSDGKYIAICEYGNGRFYNHYDCAEDGSGSSSSAGGFRNLDDARAMVYKHRPQAREWKRWYEHSDIHTYEVERLGFAEKFSVKLFENMGGRWVQLGKAEICDRDVLEETIGIYWRE